MRHQLASAASAWLLFWQQTPALAYGLAAAWACFAVFTPHPVLVIPVIIALLPTCLLMGIEQRIYLRLLLLSACLAGGIATYCYSHYHFPLVPNSGIKLTARLDIQSLSEQQGTLGSLYVLKGAVTSMDKSLRLKNAPFHMHLPKKSGHFRPTADRSYLTRIQLRQETTGRYTATALKGVRWQPIEGSWSFAERRYRSKKLINSYIREHVSSSRAASFLGGLATGIFHDREIHITLGRFGLQHIMAISGFHFAIIATVLSLALSCFLPLKHSTVILALLLTVYFLFLGYSASIARAWIMALAALGGQMLGKTSSSLNALGCALLILVVADPPMTMTLGFQFSFLATAAILLLYQPIDGLLQHLLGRRRLSTVIAMSRLEQHSYLILSLFRQAMALSCAVHVVTVPVCLLIFHKFPLMSLVYNLFFPFLVSVAMLLLLLSFLLQALVPTMAQILHNLNGLYTDTLLKLVFNAPPALDHTLYGTGPSLWFLVPYLCLLGILGIWARHSFESTNARKHDFHFI